LIGGILAHAPKMNKPDIARDHVDGEMFVEASLII